MRSPFLEKAEVFNVKTASAAEHQLLDKKKSLVSIKDLRVVYNKGKSNEARALDRVNIEIYPNEYVMFFGPSGCGKSTLLNIIAGLEVPSEGNVMVNGQSLTDMSHEEMAIFHRQTIGMVFQSYNLIPSLNVLKNVALPQIFEGVGRGRRNGRAMELLNKFGVGQYAKRLPTELSGGQQQRVGIARSLSNNPPVILADEAVGNLDSESAKNVLELLNKLNVEDKKTIIAVTHNPEHLFYADRIVYMKDGMIVKIEENRQKKMQKKNDISETRQRTALDVLFQSYPELSEANLNAMLVPFKAKALAGYLVTRFNEEQIDNLETIVKEKLMSRLSGGQLFERMHQSAKFGGFGINKKLAAEYVRIIEEIILRAEKIPDCEKNDGGEDMSLAVASIKESLLADYHGQITPEQMTALEKGIEARLLCKINKRQFREYLDKPLSQEGVGLNIKTAYAFARKLELIMLIQYTK